MQYSPQQIERIQSDCSTKHRFDCEKLATKAVQRIKQDGGPDLRVYACPWCGGFHLAREKPIECENDGDG
jgi:rubrerythrin